VALSHMIGFGEFGQSVLRFIPGGPLAPSPMHAQLPPRPQRSHSATKGATGRLPCSTMFMCSWYKNIIRHNRSQLRLGSCRLFRVDKANAIRNSVHM